MWILFGVLAVSTVPAGTPPNQEMLSDEHLATFGLPGTSVPLLDTPGGGFGCSGDDYAIVLDDGTLDTWSLRVRTDAGLRPLCSCDDEVDDESDDEDCDRFRDHAHGRQGLFGEPWEAAHAKL